MRRPTAPMARRKRQQDGASAFPRMAFTRWIGPAGRQVAVAGCARLRRLERIVRGPVTAFVRPRRNARPIRWLSALLCTLAWSSGAGAGAEPRHALAMHGEPALA